MTNTQRTHTEETLWQEIAVAALLGTQRKPYQPAQANGALGQLLSAAQPARPDDAEPLLRAVAVTAIHRRAGQLPTQGTPSFPPPCPAETRPRCSRQAGLYLEQTLGNGKSVFLPEWIECAAAHQQRIREEHLALVFEQQKALAPLRRTLLPVLGERGRWLAARNPDWATWVYFEDERAWSEGKRKERLAFLSDLRAENPARARELLTTTWAQDPPTERLAFLEILADNLSDADEPFLESALDDKRKEVRQCAAGLLARLPASRLVQRMSERARSLLHWKSGLLRSTLEVILPETCDAAMQRDGIDARPPAGSKMGEKAWLLAQILSCVPPETWSKGWSKRPAQIIELGSKHEWKDVLLYGWTEAALHSQNSEWLEALLSLEARAGEHQRMLERFPRLTPAMQERLVSAVLRDSPSLSYNQPASLYLSACRQTWSEDLTGAVINAICLTLQKGDLDPWRWEKLLRDIAPYFNPNLLETAIDRIGAALKKRSMPDPYAQNLIDALEFRLGLRRAFDLPAND